MVWGYMKACEAPLDSWEKIRISVCLAEFSGPDHYPGNGVISAKKAEGEIPSVMDALESWADIFPIGCTTVTSLRESM